MQEQVKALNLRRIGLSYDDIATEMGLSREAASALVLCELNERYPGLDDEKALELVRLDAILMAISDQVDAGHLGAVDRAIKVHEKRVSILKFKAEPLDLADLYG